MKRREKRTGSICVFVTGPVLKHTSLPLGIDSKMHQLFSCAPWLVSLPGDLGNYPILAHEVADLPDATPPEISTAASSTTVMLQQWYKTVTTVLQQWYKTVTTVLQQWYKTVTTTAMSLSHLLISKGKSDLLICLCRSQER